MRQVDWKRLEEEVTEFRDLKQQRRVIRKSLESVKQENDLQGNLLRRALAEGFFMNTSRKVPSIKQSEAGHSYLTVNEGMMLKVDRANSNLFTLLDYYPDWLIHTDLSGTASGASGLIKMAFEVELPWI